MDHSKKSFGLASNDSTSSFSRPTLASPLTSFLTGRYERLTEVLSRILHDTRHPYVEPPRSMPENLRDAFTMGGKADVFDWYLNDKPLPNQGASIQEYTQELVQKATEDVMNGVYRSYGATNRFLHEAIKSHPISNDITLIIGSVYPQFEAFCLGYGATPVTIEYNARITPCERLIFFTPDQFDRANLVADSVISISSYEHDGLGRYGDPIDPDADLKSMHNLHSWVKRGGKAFVSVPIGRDAVAWNAHRIYGIHRLPLFLRGWKILNVYGASDGLFELDQGRIKLQEKKWLDEFPSTKESSLEWVFVLQNAD